MIISIWGFMGAGKSSLGRAFASACNWTHIDSDEEIEKQENRSIATIFAEEGEGYFRDKETEYLRGLVMAKQQRKEGADSQPIILTTGGGMPIREQNRQLLKQLGTSVYIEVPFEEIVRRLQQDEQRPLWQAEQLQPMQQRFDERLPAYKQADIILPTANQSLEETVSTLIEKLTAYLDDE